MKDRQAVVDAADRQPFFASVELEDLTRFERKRRERPCDQACGTPVIGATTIKGFYMNTGHGTYGWTLACGNARLRADVLAGRQAVLNPDNYAHAPTVRGRN